MAGLIESKLPFQGQGVKGCLAAEVSETSISLLMNAHSFSFSCPVSSRLLVLAGAVLFSTLSLHGATFRTPEERLLETYIFE
jgi:hypothetical protein